MPSLKELRNRITSVKSTQKITSAMKMVSASKLRRAQERAEAGQPYAERMIRMLTNLAAASRTSSQKLQLMTGTGKDQSHLIVVITSDRGLCGSFNATITREVRRLVRTLKEHNKEIKLLCIGRKGRDNLRRDYASSIISNTSELSRSRLDFAHAVEIADRILEMFEAGSFDICTVVYNKFRSVISQVVTTQQLIPIILPSIVINPEQKSLNLRPQAIYEFEPDEERILAQLLPRNLTVQIYRMLLESAASEQGARMTAMDNATRNANEMIGKLTLTYNRTRQAYITKELIEIISGAEAL
jgi:F-type H+-transporting ATPase subunit gamma